MSTAVERRRLDYEGSSFRGFSRNKLCAVHAGAEKHLPEHVRIAGVDVPELEGDVEALKLIKNLEEHGLAGYTGRQGFSSNITTYDSSNLSLLPSYATDVFLNNLF